MNESGSQLGSEATYWTIKQMARGQCALERFFGQCFKSFKAFK